MVHATGVATLGIMQAAAGKYCMSMVLLRMLTHAYGPVPMDWERVVPVRLRRCAFVHERMSVGLWGCIACVHARMSGSWVRAPLQAAAVKHGAHAAPWASASPAAVMKMGSTYFVLGLGISPLGQEELHDRHVAVLGSRMHRFPSKLHVSIPISQQDTNRDKVHLNASKTLECARS